MGRTINILIMMGAAFAFLAFVISIIFFGVFLLDSLLTTINTSAPPRLWLAIFAASLITVAVVVSFMLILRLIDGAKDMFRDRIVGLVRYFTPDCGVCDLHKDMGIREVTYYNELKGNIPMMDLVMMNGDRLKCRVIERSSLNPQKNYEFGE